MNETVIPSRRRKLLDKVLHIQVHDLRKQRCKQSFTVRVVTDSKKTAKRVAKLQYPQSYFRIGKVVEFSWRPRD